MRIKHRDLTHYFMTDHNHLPRSYIKSCEKFFKSLKREALDVKQRARSYERRASSVKPGSLE
jgi:hypothetical protein